AQREKERNGQQGIGFDAVKLLADDGRKADRRQGGGGEHARHEREGDGHAEIAQSEKEQGHEAQDQAVVHSGVTANASRSSGPSKPRRHPLASCSIAKSAMRTPDTGTLIV